MYVLQLQIAQSTCYLPIGKEHLSTVLEAMSMGRAIITTDAPGCRETVVDGVNGYLVEVKSIQSLIDSMEKIIVQPELIQKMGQKSREIALNKYDVNAVNAHVERNGIELIKCLNVYLIL
jgi:glycosyltransferase involved in cell wall biosynthesis